MSRKGFVDFLVLIVVVAAGWWAIANQQEIKDWWVLRSYQPPESIVALADKADMNDKGRNIFYASRAELNGRDSFNQNCQFPEKSLVLGCYAGGRIYIFKVDNPELEGVEEVTAAHEMLHAAYSRLSESEREEIDALLDSAFDQINDKRIKELVTDYEKDDPGSLHNELHSILGTEVSSLPQELEDHYKLYFNDRQGIVALTQNYEKVFTGLDEKISSLSNQISTLKNQINSSEAELTSLKNQLDADSARLDSLRNQGRVAEYNAAVPGYNALVAKFNSTLASYEAQVAKHNKLVKQHNAIVTEQNQLLESLDSKFEEVE